MADENSWRTSNFRQSVVSKIDEAVRQSGTNVIRNSIEMENHVYQKSKNKEEYLSYVARLILHVREKKQIQGGGLPVAGQGQGGPGMPDPINALQNLASQGSRNPVINMGPQGGQMGGPQQAGASNLLQPLNRGPGQPMMMATMGGNMAGNMPGNISGNMPMQDRQNLGMPANLGGNQMGNQITNQIRLQQMQNSGMSQMPGHLGGQMQNPVQNQMGNQMQGQIPGQMQMGNTMANQIQTQMMDLSIKW